MNKIFTRLSLVFLIILSFYLSFFIWTNNGSSDRNTIIPKKNITQVDYTRDLSTLYAPVKVFSVDGNGDKTLLLDQLSNITSKVKKDFKDLDLKKMSLYNAVNNKQYESIIDNYDSLQLYYQSPLSIKMLSQTFGFKFDKKISEFPANRIVIVRISPIEKEIYFSNDKTGRYYYANVSLSDSKLFSLGSSSKKSVLVKEHKGSNGYITFFQKPLSLNSYTYLVKTLDDNFYVSSFMTNDGSAGLTFDSKTNTYKKGLTKSLTINNKNGMVNFEDHHLDSTAVPHNLTSLLSLSKEVMQKVGNSFNSFRYFSNPSHNKVVFCSYIDGFPVFYNDKNGDAFLSWGKTSQNFSFFNSTLEIPITASQNTKTLDATNVLLQKLKNKGISINKIQDIQLGYSWVKNNDSTEVIDLLPQYFIKINGSYKEASSLINIGKGG